MHCVPPEIFGVITLKLMKTYFIYKSNYFSDTRMYVPADIRQYTGTPIHAMMESGKQIVCNYQSIF